MVTHSVSLDSGLGNSAFATNQAGADLGVALLHAGEKKTDETEEERRKRLGLTPLPVGENPGQQTQPKLGGGFRNTPSMSVLSLFGEIYA